MQKAELVSRWMVDASEMFSNTCNTRARVEKVRVSNGVTRAELHTSRIALQRL